MLNDILNAFAAYPGWITLLLFCSLSVFVVLMALSIRKRAALARGSSIAAVSNIKAFMKIKHVKLIPDESSAKINVVVSVNGLNFVHPSEVAEQKMDALESDLSVTEADGGEIQWMPLSLGVPEKIILLPSAEMYYIRFEINFSSGKKLEGGPALVRSELVKNDSKKVASPSLATYPTMPLVAEYKLYFLQDGSRDTSVKALISYEIYLEQDTL